MSNKCHQRIGLGLCLLALCFAGCQTTTTPAGAPVASSAAAAPVYSTQSRVPMLPVAGRVDPATAPPTASADEAVKSDATALRLDDIIGDILLYFQIHKAMPPTLEALAAENPGLNITAPSGKPYVYFPQGLSEPNIPKLLVVYDPEETSRGSRFCILVSELHAGSPLTAEVKELPEVIVSAYRASAEAK